MHRGSSKGGEPTRLPSETLPLSASPPTVRVRVEVVRAGRSTAHEVLVEPGTRVRDLLRRLGQPPEGSAVLVGETPIPLDTPILEPVELVVVPTFSGG